jgi:hypothetical protein
LIRPIFQNSSIGNGDRLQTLLFRRNIGAIDDSLCSRAERAQNRGRKSTVRFLTQWGEPVGVCSVVHLFDRVSQLALRRCGLTEEVKDAPAFTRLRPYAQSPSSSWVLAHPILLDARVHHAAPVAQPKGESECFRTTQKGARGYLWMNAKTRATKPRRSPGC